MYVSVKDIFNYKTIQKLLDNVFNNGLNSNKVTIRTEQGNLSGEVELLPIQQWFFDSNFTTASHWNQSFYG